jgi:hypothetical protein
MVEFFQTLVAVTIILGGSAGLGMLFDNRQVNKSIDSNWSWFDRVALGVGIFATVITILSLYALNALIVGCILLIGIVNLINNISRFNTIKFFNTGILTLWSWRLGFVLTLVFFCVVIISGLAPTTDADTLAYHLDLPMAWSETEKLTSVERLEAFAPLTVHMLHASALILGGERSVTLLNSIAHVALFISVLRMASQWFPQLPFRWNLLSALGLASAPVLLLGLGSGKVEYWLTVWTVCGFIKLVQFNEHGDLKDAWLSGCFLGFCIASKYYGLISVIAWSGIVALCIFLTPHENRRLLLKGAWIILLGTMIFGSFWYLRNYVLLGNPLFPAFKSIFHTDILNQSHEVLLNDMMALKKPFGKSLTGFFKALVSVSFLGPAMLGPLVVFLGVGVLLRNKSVQMLYSVRAFAFIFIVVWFLLAFQRSRHLVPMLAVVVPIGAACWYMALAKWPRLRSALHGLLILGVICELSIGALIASQSAFAAFGLESPNELRSRTIPGYECVQWINEHLKNQDRLLFDRRIHSALLHCDSEQISFFSMKFIVSNVDSQQLLLKELKKNGITHILLVPLPEESWDEIVPPNRQDFANEVLYFEMNFRWILYEYLREKGTLLHQSKDRVSQGGRLFGEKVTNDVRVYRLPESLTSSPKNL